MELAQILLTLAGGGSATALIVAVAGRRKASAEAVAKRAEAAATIEDSAASAITRLQGQVAALDAKFDIVIERTSHLVRLVDIVAPIVEAEHPHLATELRDAAVDVRKAL